MLCHAQVSNLMKIHSAVLELLQAEKRTDSHGEAK
jgi:hypothetical protein